MRTDETITDYLNTQVGSLTRGTNLFSGPPVHLEIARVFVWNSGGPAPRALLEDRTRRFPRIDIRVISMQGALAYKTGADLAQLVFATLNQKDISTYVDVRCEEPAYIGKNESGQPEWSIPTTISEQSSAI